MRSPDLEFRLKNRIFDLVRLRAVESKKSLMQKLKKQSKFVHLMVLSNFMKIVKIWQQHPVLEWLLNFFYLESSNRKICFKKFQILIFSSTFA